MATPSVAHRYADRQLYDGDLLARRRLSWMFHIRPDGLGYPCRLPECQVVLMRTSENRPRWFCGRPHADAFLKRRLSLAHEIARLEDELDGSPAGTDGRYRTRADRARLSDLVFLRKTAVLYASPDDPDT